jgi:hypothetical protein
LYKQYDFKGQVKKIYTGGVGVTLYSTVCTAAVLYTYISMDPGAVKKAVKQVRFADNSQSLIQITRLRW